MSGWEGLVQSCKDAPFCWFFFFLYLRTSQTVPFGNSWLCVSVGNSCHAVSPTAAHFYSEKNMKKMFLSLKFPFKCCFHYVPEMVWFDGLALLTMKMSTFIPYYHPLHWRYCRILVHNKPAGPLHIPFLYHQLLPALDSSSFSMAASLQTLFRGR